jgi:hypothetical protein
MDAPPEKAKSVPSTFNLPAIILLRINLSWGKSQQ